MIMWLSMYWQKWNTHIKYKNVECKIWNTKYKNRKWKNEKMKTSTGSSTLTWMQDFLCFWMTCAEGGVELEMVDVVEESWTHREEDVLKVKVEMKVKQVEFENSFEWKWVQLKNGWHSSDSERTNEFEMVQKKVNMNIILKMKVKVTDEKVDSWNEEMDFWNTEDDLKVKWRRLKVKVKKLNWRTRLNEMHMV